MFTTKIIFITITFIILVVISFKMKVAKSSFPLFFIYLIFILTDSPQEEANYKANNSTLSKPNEEKSNLKILEKQNNTLEKAIEKNVKPEPLIINELNGKLTNAKQKIVEKNILDNQPKEEVLIKNLALVVKDIKICKSIYKRTPVGSDLIFTNNVDSLYCYTRIQNPGQKREVKHIWYFKDQMMTQVRYNVRKSNIYRSWTKKTILPNQIGDWRVDIQDNNGTIIGTKSFKIKNISDFNR